MDEQNAGQNSGMDTDEQMNSTIPQPTEVELANGQTVKAPPANLHAAKGVVAAQKRAEGAVARGEGDRVNPGADLDVPQPTGQGEIHDEPLLHRLPVYGADGKQVGILSDRPSRQDHLIVQSGTIIPHDLYVPRGAIERQDEHGVYLALRSDEVDSQGWETLPNS